MTMLEVMLQVEANDAVTVVSMMKPKSQPNEILVDMAVSAATKLQHLQVCFVLFLALHLIGCFY
jgi:mediator of RNA polymerase II transcription subunit 17